MKTMLWQIQSSAAELRRTRVIAMAGMLVAISVLLSTFNIMLSQVLRISFAFLPIAAGGMLFGPVVGALMGALGDVLGYLVHPSGPFFPDLRSTRCLPAQSTGSCFMGNLLQPCELSSYPH